MLSLSKTREESFISTWLLDIGLLLIGIGALYLCWLGSYPLFNPDEGRYSEIAREMVVTGDYITPRLNGVVFLDKPLMYYWLQASAIKMFGLSEWALRFWPMMLGLLGCLMTYVTGRRLFNRRVGLLASCILATSPLYFGGSHYANLDLEVAVFITCSLFSLLMGLHLPKARTTWLFASYFFAGIAALTKGLIGIAFPFLILGSWIFLLKRWQILKTIYLVPGLLLFAAITVPVYLLIQKANPQFFHFFFVVQQFSRFLAHGSYNNQVYFWFYFPIISVGFFPWSVYLLQTFYSQIKTTWKQPQTYSAELFLLLWVFIVFLFFSIPHSKTVGYILPIFAPLALLTAIYLDKIWNAPDISFRIGNILMFLSCIFVVVVSLTVPSIKALDVQPSLIPYLHLSAAVGCAAGFITFFYIWKQNVKNTVIFASLFSCALLLILISSTSAINTKSVKWISTQLQTVLTPQDEIATFYKYYQDLPIYLQRRITIVNDWKAPDIIQNDNWIRELWFGIPYQDTSAWLIDETTFWKRWESKKRMFVLLNSSYLEQFTKSAHHRHIYKITERDNVIVMSNRPVNLNDTNGNHHVK